MVKIGFQAHTQQPGYEVRDTQDVNATCTEEQLERTPGLLSSLDPRNPSCEGQSVVLDKY